MYKKLAFILAVIAVLAFAGQTLAAPPFTIKQQIMYDGYLYIYDDQDTLFIAADTLFVVNNFNKVTLPVWIEVYDKYGDLEIEHALYNGGVPLVNNLIPVRGFGWITLGMLVNRATVAPTGDEGGAEKFTVIITTGKGDSGNLKPTIVEVKQVIYEMAASLAAAKYMIWEPGNIRTWCETALGGRKGPGVVKYPSKWD